MNDFLTVMGQLGVESILPETDLTLEQEMNEEISTEAELDEAYSGMEYSGIVAATSQAEAMLTAMAEREIGLESNAGADPCKIYQDFGLEAVKDVVARKAYSTVASIKALINSCISWLKQLVGIAVASKKVFSGIAKKAKAMDKSLREVASKKMSEKLNRDMPAYSKVANNLISRMGYKPLWMTSGKMSDEQKQRYKERGKDDADRFNDKWDTTDEIQKKMDELDDVYDKNDTTEYEGSACYNHVLSNVKSLYTSANKNKTNDIIKPLDDRIKDLEKFKKDIDKKDSGIVYIEGTTKMLNNMIKSLTKLSNYRKKVLKIYVRVADDCLTMAKGVYAALV